MDRRRIFTIIFRKESVSDEELWNAGFGLFQSKIETGAKNILQYSKYKKNILHKQFLNKIEYVKTSWVKLPKEQKNQIEVIMKIIAYAVISLKDVVTVYNATGTTLQLLEELGYDIWRSGDTTWIKWNEVRKTEAETKYLTAYTAKNLSNFINQYVLYNFLVCKWIQGKQYVIIPVTDIPIQDSPGIETTITALANDVLEHLGLEFDLETFVTSHGCKPLAFIDLRLFGSIEEKQMKQLEPLNNYLPV